MRTPTFTRGRHLGRRRLLIDGTDLSNRPKGVGRYAYHLCIEVVSRLSPEWEVYIAVRGSDIPEFPSNFDATFIPLAKGSELRLGLIQMPLLVTRLRPDAILYAGEKAGFAYHAIQVIMICHDIDALITAAQNRGTTRTRRAIDAVKQLLRTHALRESQWVVCNSVFIREAVGRFYGIPLARTKLGYCGIDPRFYDISTRIIPAEVLAKYGVQRYVLAFATGDPRENYMKLPEVARSVRDHLCKTSFLIGGIRRGDLCVEELRNEFRRQGLMEGSDFRFVDFFDEEHFCDLVELYRCADFYLELSAHEGFGMQLAEAMACGTTCVSSLAGALGEVGGPYVIPIKHLVTSEIVDAIVEAYRYRLHERDNSQQVAYTRRFSWHDVGETVAALLQGQYDRPAAGVEG